MEKEATVMFEASWVTHIESPRARDEGGVVPGGAGAPDT